MPNTIVLRDGYGGQVVRREDNTTAAVTPGHLLEFNANDLLQPHSTAGGNAQPLFAVEEDYIGNSVADAFTSGDKIPYVAAGPGTIIWAHLASGENVARGAHLESNGDGQLRAHVQQSAGNINVNNIVGIADEDANASSGDLRFRLEVV